MIRKVVIVVLTLASASCIMAACLLGRFPTRYDCPVLRTDSCVVEATILDTVLSIGIAQCNEPRILDQIDEDFALRKGWKERGGKRKGYMPLFSFHFEWRTPCYHTVHMTAAAPILVEHTSIVFPLFIPTTLFAADLPNHRIHPWSVAALATS